MDTRQHTPATQKPRQGTAGPGGTGTLAALQAAYPNWSIWQSRTGKFWCATRRRPLSPAEWYGKSWMTLIEDDPGNLAAQLRREQATDEQC